MYSVRQIFINILVVFVKNSFINTFDTTSPFEDIAYFNVAQTGN